MEQRERERERGATFISTGNTESAASSSATTAASGRHSGDVVNEQSFEPNMLSPRSVEPIFNLSRCGARASASRFPVCQTGKPGQTFELAQTVWHPTTYRRRGPRILNMLLYHRHRFICGCLSDEWTNERTNVLSVSGSLCPRNFLPPRLPSRPRSAESSKVVHMHHAAPRFRPRCLLSLGGNRWFWPRIADTETRRKQPWPPVVIIGRARSGMKFVLIRRKEGMEILFLDDYVISFLVYDKIGIYSREEKI